LCIEGNYLCLLAPTDDSQLEESREKAVDTILSEVETLYYSNFTMNMEAFVAGGKNLMLSENKMEFDVLADVIENNVCTHCNVIHYQKLYCLWVTCT
jgi:hypothetical protein